MRRTPPGARRMSASGSMGEANIMRQSVMPRHCLNALALPSLLLIGLAGGAQSLQAPASQESQSPFQISVNVDLVVLNATVRDSKGRFAPDLRSEEHTSELQSLR